MKKLFLFAIALLFNGFVCHSQESRKVGLEKNGKFTITEDIGSIKTEWKSMLSKQNITEPLIDYEIASGVDTGLSDEKYFYLIGSSKDKTVKVCRILILNKGIFYLESSTDDASPGTVSCTGCASSCNPVKIGGRWFCTQGCINNCTKTVTVNANINTN